MHPSPWDQEKIGSSEGGDDIAVKREEGPLLRDRQGPNYDYTCISNGNIWELASLEGCVVWEKCWGFLESSIYMQFISSRLTLQVDF